MTNCVNIRTIFSVTRVSTFCVDEADAAHVLGEILGAIGSDWAQEAILELVSVYGKRAVLPGDVTVGAITILVGKAVVEYSGTPDKDLLDAVGAACAAHGYRLSLGA
jgi:hypothetical protein